MRAAAVVPAARRGSAASRRRASSRLRGAPEHRRIGVSIREPCVPVPFRLPCDGTHDTFRRPRNSSEIDLAANEVNRMNIRSVVLASLLSLVSCGYVIARDASQSLHALFDREWDWTM